LQRALFEAMNARSFGILLAAVLAASAVTTPAAAARRGRKPAARPATAAPASAPARDTIADDHADISFTAHVQAKEVQFTKTPTIHVTFPGVGPRDTINETWRENLPDKVQPGVTYHDVGVHVRVQTTFKDLDRVLREAFGDSLADSVANEPPPSPAPLVATPSRSHSASDTLAKAPPAKRPSRQRKPFPAVPIRRQR